MANYGLLTEKDKQAFIEHLSEILANSTGIVSTSYDGNCSAPSVKKRFYRFANAVFHEDNFNGLNELMESTVITIVVKKK